METKDGMSKLVLCPDCRGDSEWGPCKTCGDTKRVTREQWRQFYRNNAPPATPKAGGMYKSSSGPGSRNA